MDNSSSSRSGGNFGPGSGPEPEERDALLDDLLDPDEDPPTLNYVQQVVTKYRRGKDGEKRAAQLKGTRDQAKARKLPLPVEATGLKSAVYEWARALLGIPRQSSSPSSSYSTFTVSKHLQNHLPACASDSEVDEWTNRSAMRSNWIDDRVKQEMSRLLLSNPKATEPAKNELKKNVTKRVAESYDKSHPPVKFKSRVAKASASIVTYDSSKLSYAEAALSQCGFPRLTFQWGTTLASAWNQATINSLVSSWLDCYNAKGVPSSYIIDETTLEVPRLAKEMLIQWLTHKRSLYSQQEREKKLVAEEGGAEKLRKKIMNEKEKRTVREMRKQLAKTRQEAIFKYTDGFNPATRYFLSDPAVHSETEMTEATPNNPPGFRRIKLAWRSPELDNLISLADIASTRRIKDPSKRKKEEQKEALRSVYSTEKVPAEDQLPPTGFPKALVKASYLQEDLDEIVVDGLELSNEKVAIKEVIEILNKKLSPAIRMNTT